MRADSESLRTTSPETEPKVQPGRAELHLGPLEAAPQDSQPLWDLIPEPARRQDTFPVGTLCLKGYSPPRDLELIDRALAVVVVDEVFVTHPNALVVHSEALG